MIDGAAAADGPALAALWEACGLTRPWNDPIADIERALRGPSSTILVAREAGAVIGSVMVGWDGHRGWMYYLAVAPAHRGQGLGRALVHAAEEWLRAHYDIPKVQLIVRAENPNLETYYQALGYVRADVLLMMRRMNEEEDTK
ncbi:MAG: GNAT family acetyltransferase [Alphaproteobacteria bacterium]|jgi:ribosomal protein S18 acetylase RimI-like enzyme|nr:GNAT family acetyltransferase [Alphaproteobacteria bacterium]